MNKAIYDAKRERDILDKVTRDAGPDLDLYARRFFEALFSLSRTYQSEQLFHDNEFTVKMKKAIEESPTLPPQRGSVACAGVFGSNAQVACDKLLPLSQIHYVTGFRAVFDAVESGECQFGVLPIENSSNGSVKEVYDFLEDRKCYNRTRYSPMDFSRFTREKRHKTRRYSHYHLPSSSVGPMQPLPREIRRRRNCAPSITRLVQHSS